MPARFNFEDLCGEKGRNVLAGHLMGVPDAAGGFAALVEAALGGDLDDALKTEPDAKAVHVTTSAHLLTLAALHRLNGLRGIEFYKGDPLRYVRLNLLIQRLLGLERLTIGWPVYAFGAEALGQTMMYPDDQAPGSDPGEPLVILESWRGMPGYDRDHEVARVVREMLIHTSRLAGIEPVAHLPAPYSLAAEILGQEPLISALLSDPDEVRTFLDHLVDTVFTPWCEDLVATVPNVWLELSDASGSPMFIGPQSFLSLVVDPVRRLIAGADWGPRVFVANYRGDSSPADASRGRRRRQSRAKAGLSFDSLLEAKVACCPFFIIRLEADAASEQTYAEVAISRGLPLYLGIGAVRLDRNSVVDHAAARSEIRDTAFQRASLIRSVRSEIRDKTGGEAALSWPGDLYIEDTNGQTDMDLFAAVLEGCAAANAATNHT